MNPDDLRECASRERAVLTQLESLHWQERRQRLGPGEALRMADELREWYRLRHPDWPTAADREADLAVHARVGAALRSVASSR